MLDFIQSFLILAIVYVLGCVSGCFAWRKFGSTNSGSDSQSSGRVTSSSPVPTHSSSEETSPSLVGNPHSGPISAAGGAGTMPASAPVHAEAPIKRGSGDISAAEVLNPELSDKPGEDGPEDRPVPPVPAPDDQPAPDRKAGSKTPRSPALRKKPAVSTGSKTAAKKPAAKKGNAQKTARTKRAPAAQDTKKPR